MLLHKFKTNVPVRSAAAVAVVHVVLQLIRVGRYGRRRLAGRVVRAAGYDAKVPGAQHGALPVGRRRGRLAVRRQLARRLRPVVDLVVHPGRPGVAEQRPERLQELLAVRRRVPRALLLINYVVINHRYCGIKRVSDRILIFNTYSKGSRLLVAIFRHLRSRNGLIFGISTLKFEHHDIR